MRNRLIGVPFIELFVLAFFLIPLALSLILRFLHRKGEGWLVGAVGSPYGGLVGLADHEYMVPAAHPTHVSLQSLSSPCFAAFPAPSAIV